MREKRWLATIGLLMSLSLVVTACPAMPGQEGVEDEEMESTPVALEEETPAPEEPAATEVPEETPTPSGPTPTPTITPTPGPSAATMRSAVALHQGVAELQQALAFNDRETLLKAQKELSTLVAQAEAAAEADQAPATKQFRDALDELRDGLAGDTARLDSAQRKLAEFTSSEAAALGTPRAGLPMATPQPTVQVITDIVRYADDLADKVEALETAQGGELLRLQQEVMSELERGKIVLERSGHPKAQTVKSALEDLDRALGGDQVKYQSAVEKLRSLSGSTGPSGQATPGATADLQPIVGEINNRLDGVRNAVNNDDQEALEKARRELAEQVNKAESRLSGDQSARAQRLRSALGAVREVASGDNTKIDAARDALQQALSGQ